MTMNKGDRVTVLPIGQLTGTVTNIRHDDRDVPILTITLDDETATPDGLYFARECEVKPLEAAR